MRRRLLIPLAAAAAVAIPAVAAAHTPAVADNCHNLTVTLTNYEGTTPNNRVTVTIDGTTQTFDYGASFARTFGWSPTAPHAWTVVVDANRVHGDPTEFDRTFNGSEQPCQTPPSSTTTSTPTTTTSTAPPDTPTSTTATPTTTTTATDQSSTSTTSTTAPPSAASSTSSTPTPSGPAATTSPTAPPERLDALPETGGSTIDPWLPPAIILFAAYLLLAARRARP